MWKLFCKKNIWNNVLFSGELLVIENWFPPAFIQRRDSGKLALRNSVFCQSVVFCHTAPPKCGQVFQTTHTASPQSVCAVTQSVPSHSPCASCVQCWKGDPVTKKWQKHTLLELRNTSARSREIHSESRRKRGGEWILCHVELMPPIWHSLLLSTG